MWLIFCHLPSRLRLLPSGPTSRPHARLRPFSSRHDDGLHTKYRPSQDFHPVHGALKFAGRVAHVNETFLRRDEALHWSRVAELAVDRNETPVSARIRRLTRFADLVDLHIEDMAAVGRPPQSSKAATLAMLRAELGDCKSGVLDRERLVQFGRARSEGYSSHSWRGASVEFTRLFSVSWRV